MDSIATSAWEMVMSSLLKLAIALKATIASADLPVVTKYLGDSCNLNKNHRASAQARFYSNKSDTNRRYHPSTSNACIPGRSLEEGSNTYKETKNEKHFLPTLIRPSVNITSVKLFATSSR